MNGTNTYRPAHPSQQEYMYVGEVAKALDVETDTVYEWIEQGWLRCQKGGNSHRNGQIVHHDDVLSFLYERGGLLPFITPHGYWKDCKEQARENLESRLIERQRLLSLLGIPPTRLVRLRREKDFPLPSLKLPNIEAYWYDRDEVRTWLDFNPELYTHAVRSALGSNGKT